MSRLKELFVICLIILAILGLTSLTQSAAQPVQSSGEQTMQALLSEVHQLRVVLQRSNLNAYHAQITIERMKLQQQRVDRLTAQLGDIRHQLADTRRALSQKSTELKGAEMGLAQETNAAERATRESYIRGTKFELEELTQKEQQQQEAETPLNAQLQVEQAKLTELSERLDTLQREMETQLSTDKPQPSGKHP